MEPIPEEKLTKEQEDYLLDNCITISDTKTCNEEDTESAKAEDDNDSDKPT